MNLFPVTILKTSFFLRGKGGLGTDDDFGLPFVIFSFGVPNSTKMPAAVPGR